MSFLDRFRPKWKHADPAVRAHAVRELTDPYLLETIVDTDESVAVRLAAVQALTDQEVLARLARADSALAVPAMKRLTDRALLVKVALSAELPAVREMAIEHIDDSVILHRIATSDTNAEVRSKARLKRLGPDQTRDFIRSELSKLQLAHRQSADMAGFCGTLDDVCRALIGDARFRINGGVDENEPRIATICELSPTPPEGSGTPFESLAQREARARFLAFKRGSAGESAEGATSNIFFEINVWRTDTDTFLCQAEEKRLKIVQDAVEWSRVSNGNDTGTLTKTSAGPR